MSDDVYKARLERSAAAKRRRRAEETEEERRAKQRAYAAAWRARRSTSLDAGASTSSGPSLMSGVNGSETMETTSSSETSFMDALNAEETIVDASNGDDAASMNTMERYNFNRRKRRAEETVGQRIERLAKRRVQYAAKKGERNEARRKRRAQEKEERLNKNREKSLIMAEPDGDILVQRREEHERRVGEFESGSREFHKRFTNNPFGYECSVCGRLWHKDKLTSDRKKESASCCTHGKSTKPVQTEASWLFSSSVDVAVETSRSIDVCKSTQTSPVAVKVHMWTETTDLVESKDSDTHLPEFPAPYMWGMPRLTNKNEIPKVPTLYFIK
ncbi:apical junction molecule ajm-1-like isoform X2 [Dermacentor albipictus]|uniref:apical junction molecule ajm-1-like isoform X2 n=1 Tax=Dermacentor albipictus TaxID=60249 RepID=UPI0038FC9DCE